MLTTLKAKIKNDIEFKDALESSIEYITEQDDGIKDIFLDDPDAMLIGSENDPEIAKLVDTIPEDVNPETTDVTEKDIEELVENYVPMSTLLEKIDNGYEDSDSGDGDLDEQGFEDLAETDMGLFQHDIEDADDIPPQGYIEEGSVMFDEYDMLKLAEECGITDFCNIDGHAQHRIEDSDDDSIRPEDIADYYVNIDGDEQERIEDSDDDSIRPEDIADYYVNILGDEQEDIVDVKEGSDDPDLDDDDLDEYLDDDKDVVKDSFEFIDDLEF